MKFEVDQSVRIEELNRDTAIGIGSKDVQRAFILPRKVKRHFNKHFRRLGKPRQCASTLFAASIVIALQKSSLQPGSLIIDTEYARHENFIISFISFFFPRAVITIKRVGKNSPGHEAAYFTHIKKRKPDGNITQREIEKILEIKKTAREPHHREFTRIRKPTTSLSKRHHNK